MVIGMDWGRKAVSLCLGDCRCCRKCLRDGSVILQGGALRPFDFDPAGRRSEGSFGLAVDIGTTTVVCYLFSMRTGELAGVLSAPNAQRTYGADVVARLLYCLEHGHEDLTAAIVGQVNALAEELLNGRGEIVDTVVAGNTVMQHLHSGLSPVGLAAAPFAPETLFGQTRGGVYYCPCASAYVGGDVTAGLLSVWPGESAAAYLDLGTNGEMALWTGEQILVAATAAGPAFEAGEISCGMPAVDGAISHVFSDGDALSFTVIGGKAPQGVCGSGLLDLAAELLRRGVIERSGYMKAPFQLCEGVELLPQDVRQLQLAKAAVSAGMRMLAGAAQAPGALYLAGGFASYMRIVSARAIGLLPPGVEVRPAGHAAGLGACLALLSQRERDNLEALAARCRAVELSGDERFQESYIDAMAFEPM